MSFENADKEELRRNACDDLTRAYNVVLNGEMGNYLSAVVSALCGLTSAVLSLDAPDPEQQEAVTRLRAESRVDRNV